MQTPTSPTDPQLTLSSTLGGLTVALQVHLAPAAWQPPSAARSADEASAVLAGVTSALAAEMPQALGQARKQLQRSLEVALVLQAQAQLATALGSHDGAVAADTPAPASTADGGGQTIAFLSGDAQPLKLESGDRRFWVEHPSRSAVRAPSCADCKYKLVLKNRPQFWFCNHPTTPVDAVTGNPNMVCESARGSAPHKLCGVAGQLFEPLHQAVG